MNVWLIMRISLTFALDVATNSINLTLALLTQKALRSELRNFRKVFTLMNPRIARRRIRMKPKMLIGQRSTFFAPLLPFNSGKNTGMSNKKWNEMNKFTNEPILLGKRIIV